MTEGLRIQAPLSRAIGGVQILLIREFARTSATMREGEREIEIDE